MNIFKETTKHKPAFFLIAFGVLLLMLSFFFKILGSDPNGMELRAVSIASVGAAFALFGVGLKLGSQANNGAEVRASRLTEIPNLPNLLWVVIGFFIAYVIFLIVPMFFDSGRSVFYFKNYLTGIHPIGADFTTTLDSSKSWFAQGIARVYYPPLVTILFAPFALTEYPLNYYVITLITLISYFIAAGLLPLLMAGKGNRSTIPFIFGVSIFSYGLQFELERGQFHTIAMLFCILAIYIFHRHPRYRFFAYILFCMSVQFKVYPALFVLMFVDDWRDWKTNLKRFAALGMANFLLLFLLGYSYFSRFIAHMMTSGTDPREIWSGNHSISSFFGSFASPQSRFLDADAHAWLQQNMGLIIGVFVAYFAICLLLVWMNAYRRNTHGVDSFLFMTCVLGALIIPSINHDYTLPLLTAPLALMMSESFTQIFPRRILVILLLIASSFIYTMTLVPSIHKPVYLQSAFPLLILLLATTTMLSFLRDQGDVAAATAA